MRNAYIQQDKMDSLVNIFPKPTGPAKRSVAARSSKFAFLEEITDEELKSYTSEQLVIILNQRDHVSFLLYSPPRIFKPTPLHQALTSPAPRNP